MSWVRLAGSSSRHGLEIVGDAEMREPVVEHSDDVTNTSGGTQIVQRHVGARAGPARTRACGSAVRDGVDVDVPRQELGTRFRPRPPPVTAHHMTSKRSATGSGGPADAFFG